MRSLHLMVAIASQALPLVALPLNASTSDTSQLPASAESYFRENTASGLLYIHISLMLLAWVGALPICIMLNIARSNLRYPFHIAFLGLHGIGTIFGMAYKSKTPDLYPGSSHNTLGWVLTALILAHFLVGILKSFAKHTEPDRGDQNHELQPFIVPSDVDAREPSYEQRNQSSSPRQTSQSPARSEDSHDETECETLFDDADLHYNSSLEHRFREPISWSRRWANVSRAPFLFQVLDVGFDIFFRLLLPLGFVAICTGVVTMAGIFHGKHILNGLAHFIKGGIFFWWGILTLGRWTGCFSSLGWAWNRHPSGEKHHGISMEAVECSVIFLYGILNVFLEHLAEWGGKWAPEDLEHVAISLLFIGGGLCGLMVEPSGFHRITEKGDYEMYIEENGSMEARVSPSSPVINPIPTMIILLLGGILAGHHQTSMESTMMHKTVGNNLTAVAAARSLTYLLLHISPPTSHYPSRPASEPICAFSLMCGGIMLMASNKDTTQAMVDNGIDAMFVSSVTMGVIAMLMAWTIVTLRVKTWAIAREERWRGMNMNVI